MSSWRFVLHCHTNRSYDSETRPQRMVEVAVALGIDVLAVTDHDTWQGSVEVREAAKRIRAPLRVILGTEVYTDQGDVIGIFIRKDIRETGAAAFCDLVHAQGGLVYLPHPYRSHHLDEDLMRRVDLVEVFNARTHKSDNDKAEQLARKRRLAMLVGPDAHHIDELGLGINEFPGKMPADEDGIKRALLNEPRVFHTGRGSIWNEWKSQCVKLRRRPSITLAYQIVRGGVRRLVKPAEYRLE